jgi:hypothetical protein
MTNIDKLNRIQEIEIQQRLLNDEIKMLYSTITKEINDESYLIAQEIYNEKTLIMKSLVLEKIDIMIGLGFMPDSGSVNESLRETGLWKQIEKGEVKSEVADSRYSLCTNCPEFVTISKQCKPLGVFAKEYSSFESSTCPIGNW